ncbi:DUF1579 family protein [Streptomyces sp. NPDC013953]|uniref:DUF1579 family protein n=1 Tax=Streptomyces sp. NPDC013953 TaxID=3364868 RepID=UPI0037001879
MPRENHPVNKRWLAAGALAVAVGLSGTLSASAAPAQVPAAVRTAAGDDVLGPGPYHRSLDPLVGNWKATKYNYVLGTGGEPVVSRDIRVKVRWIEKTGGRFLEERTEGTLAGRPYYRIGIMGYSTIDRRYEWTTFDSVTPTAMTYRGLPGTGTATEISVPGEFTDPGILGPEYTGRTILMRTVFRIDSADRHTVDLYFTPPGQRERLVDRVVYRRS